MKRKLQPTIVLLIICFLSLNVYGQLSGTYFIDQTATGTDLFLNGGRYFTAFNEVLDTLWSQGVSSAVTFQVAGGQTFNEQLQIDDTFPGSSANNTIEFKYQGGNKPILQPDSEGLSPLIGVIDIRFNGDYYLTFNGIKINAQNSGLVYRRGVRIIWGADHVTIKNCEIVDFASDGIAIYYGGGIGGENEGCENNILENNEIYHNNLSSTDFAQMTGIWVNGGVNTIVRNNFVHDLIGGLSSTVGIETRGSADTNYCDIYNNFISIGGNISSDIRMYGVFSQHSPGPDINILHNSVYLSGVLANSDEFTSGIRLANNSATYLKNNIVYNARTGTTGTADHYAIYIGTTSYQYEGDYNDYYSDGNNLGYYSAQNADLASWQSASGQDDNSISVDPLFISTTDLHVLQTSPVSDVGTGIPGLSLDIDGDQRDLLNPDMGADEFSSNPENEPPVASDDISSTKEDISVVIDVLSNDNDPDGDLVPWSVTIQSDALNGTTSVNSSTGAVTYTPDANYYGDDSFTYTVNDNSAESSNTATVDITIGPMNDAPTVANPIADQQATEDASFSFTFPVNTFSEIDPGDNLSYSSTLTSGGDLPSWLDFTPGSRNFSGIPRNEDVGTINIRVSATDDSAATVFEDFPLEVLNTNDIPVITDQSTVTTLEDTERTITLNDLTVTDPDNTYPDDFTLNVQNGTNYTRSGNTITPIAEFSGLLTVPVTVNDGTDDSESFDLSVTVTVVNDIPVITGQSTLTTPEETALAITLANLTVTDPDDTYPDDFTLTVQSGTNYTFSGNSITPLTNFNGNLTVLVTVNDGTANSDVFNLIVSVTPINDVPVITAQSPLGTPEETALAITLANLTVTDPDNTYPDDFTLSVQDGENYSRTNNTITPDANFNGALTVPVTVNDGVATSEVFNVNVSVSSENDVPVITAQVALSTPEETALEITLANLTVTDPDNTYPDDFTLSVRDGENYTRTDNTITPVTDFNGDLTVAISVNDGLADSEEFNLTVSVTPINDVPVITTQVALSTPEETALEITLAHLTVTDPDNTYPDDFTLSVQDGDDYTRTDNSITPVANFNGDLTVPVTVNDGTADSEVFNLVVSVDAVNDPPVISDLPEMIFKEDSSLRYTISELLGYVDDSDNPNSELQFMLYPGENVSVALVEDTLVVIGAPENWNGFDTLSVIVSDGELADSALIYVEVKPVNDAPLFAGLPDTVEIYLMAEEEMNLEEFADDYDFDMPKDSLRWQVSVSDDSLKFDFDPETKDLILTAPEYADVFTVTITVMDDSGATAEGLFYVNVTADPTGIAENLEYGIPTSYELNQNYPNPFNPTTHIKFGMPQAGDVVLEVYNLLGQKIVTLFDGYKSAGYHLVDFDASNLPTGIYFYRIQSDKFQSVKKMMLVK